MAKFTWIVILILCGASMSMGLRVGDRDWVAAVLLIGGFPLFVGITFAIQRRMRRASEEIAKLQQDMRVLGGRLEALETAMNASRTESLLRDPSRFTSSQENIQ